MSRIPDPNALRRDRKDDVNWTSLDPNKSVIQTPAWPLVTPTIREIELWEVIWQHPQSILWDLNSQELEVALFIRRLGEVELRGATASLHTLLIRQMESLLLTTASMYRAKVKIANEVAKPAAQDANRSKAQESIRERVKLVPILHLRMNRPKAREVNSFHDRP